MCWFNPQVVRTCAFRVWCWRLTGAVNRSGLIRYVLCHEGQELKRDRPACSTCCLPGSRWTNQSRPRSCTYIAGFPVSDRLHQPISGHLWLWETLQACGHLRAASVIHVCGFSGGRYCLTFRGRSCHLAWRLSQLVRFRTWSKAETTLVCWELETVEGVGGLVSQRATTCCTHVSPARRRIC